MDPSLPTAQAVFIQDGRFAAVGTDREILSCADADTEIHDLGGAAVCPGLIDSHLHILNLAVTSQGLVLNDLRSREEFYDAISKYASKLQEGRLIEGRGFNEDLWKDNRLPTRTELDEVSCGHPVIITRVCGHLVVANTAAITLSGVTEETKVSGDGEIDLLRGIFTENAIELLHSPGKERSIASCAELLEDGLNRAADAGLTCIFSDDIGTDGYDMHTVTSAYRLLEREGRMPVRVVQQCALPTEGAFSEFVQSGFTYGSGSDLYRIGPRKLYADGSLGARTAWLSRPYADAPDRSGVAIYSQEALDRLAVQSHASGFPFIVHAIGDAAVECVLNAIRCARRCVPGTEAFPDGIVHCQITTPKLLERILKENVHVYAQPVFTEYDLHICRSRVGIELEQTSYQWKTLLNGGANISSGSDCPVEPPDPALNIYCAVNRMDFSGMPQGGWFPGQRLTVEEAILCHTVKAAQSVGLNDRLGMIRKGFLADMSVFPHPFDQIPPQEIMHQKPIMTVMGGQVRMCR